MAFAYFDTAHAIAVHDEIVNSSGGLLGVAKPGQLDSIFDFVRNDEYYLELEDKLSYLFFAVNTGHCFVDGNKRASVALSAYFLEINNCGFIVNRFIEQMENISVDVADNRISRELLFEIISSLIYEEDYSEELKLKIIYAKGLNREEL
jgi:death-on-curing protein